jgi:hypothetical protein
MHRHGLPLASTSILESPFHGVVIHPLGERDNRRYATQYPIKKRYKQLDYIHFMLALLDGNHILVSDLLIGC